MSEKLIVECNHCGLPVEVPTEIAFRFSQGVLARIPKISHLPEHMKMMQEKRWSKLLPKQQAIVDLSKSCDITKLTRAEIADKIGLVGPFNKSYVTRYLRKLRAKGLIPLSP